MSSWIAIAFGVLLVVLAAAFVGLAIRLLFASESVYFDSRRYNRYAKRTRPECDTGENEALEAGDWLQVDSFLRSGLSRQGKEKLKPEFALSEEAIDRFIHGG